MIKNMKNISISGIVILIVFSSGLLLSAEQSDIPEPEMLQESYLQGSREEKSQQCSKEVASALGEECSSCHNNDVTDFTEKGGRAKEDMKAATAIGVKCDYCHAGEGQFTDKLDVAARMFKLSEMMDIECNYCHAGKDILTHEGKMAKTAMLLQKWSETGNKKCLDCHVEKKQFELNFRGWEILNAQKGLLGM
jgi:nitrate/TMAO reductase-like tetraheme cytochrome c subunit